MDAGVTYAKQWNLRPGIALTATQIAQLTSDLIWLVNENVTLPDGSVQTVLTPRLYVVTQPGDLTPNGALISGNNVIFDTDGKVNNSGTIAARNLVQVTAGDIDNLGGRIQGTQVALGATRDINVMGGSIAAAQTLLMHADNDVNIASVVGPYGGNISQLASVGVTGNKANPANPDAPLSGVLSITAGKNLTLDAVKIDNQASNAKTQLKAGQDISLGTVQTTITQGAADTKGNYFRQSNTAQTGTTINSTGSLLLNAGNDIDARAAQVDVKGALQLKAGNDVNILSAQSSQSVDDYYYTHNSGLFSSSSHTTADHNTWDCCGLWSGFLRYAPCLRNLLRLAVYS